MKRHQSKNKKPRSPLRFRLNLLFFIAFLLLAILVAQLGYLQIVYGDKFEAQIERTDKTVVSGDVPRGMIYDSQGRLLVGNTAQNAITYTKSVNVQSDEMLNTAKRLSQYLTVPVAKLSAQDLIDYYLADSSHYRQVLAKIPTKQKTDAEGNQLTESQLYHLASRYVKKHVDTALTSNKDQQIATIYTKMAAAYQLSTVYLKDQNVTAQEVAVVGEHLAELPGIAVGTNWERDYPHGDSISSILGTVTTEKQGLPEESLNSMLAQGYSRNDRVGNSYLEKQYESILRGSKSQTQIEVNSDNQILSTVSDYSGSKGGNLQLTLDSAFQAKVEEDVKAAYKEAQQAGKTQYSDGAYAVAMNPKTGAIYAIAGLQHNSHTNKTTDDSLGVINRTFVMGSSVKPATVLGALMSGAITTTDNTLPDDPIYLPATPVKKSVYPIGTYSSLNAVKALEVSSNIYMMRLTLREANAQYVPHRSIKMDNDIFEKMRNVYQQFGLGHKTGIDLSSEVDGYLGPTKNENNELKVGSALDLSYGNYDAYTLIQMAQYVSTVANGGYRLQPYLVDSIKRTNDEGKQSAVIYQHQPTVLNRVAFTNAQLNLVHQGMYDVVHGSSGSATSLSTLKPEVAGKTGTAQSFYYDPSNPNNTNPPETITSSFVGFAPYKDPKVAIAVVIPNLNVSSSTGGEATRLAKSIFTDYYEMMGTD